MIVRFRYSKLDQAVYIGHLEMTKLFERAFRRSGVAVKYTEGYNPTVKLNFAAPLSVGIRSLCEVAEIEVEDESVKRFGHLDLPRGVALLDYKVVEKGQPLMSRLAYADYTLSLCRKQIRFGAAAETSSDFVFCGNVGGEGASDFFVCAEAEAQSAAWEKRLEDFIAAEEVPFEKRTKKGSKTVNMKDYIRHLQPIARHPFGLRARLVSGNLGSLNPGALAQALFPEVRDVLITREDLLDSDERTLF